MPKMTQPAQTTKLHVSKDPVGSSGPSASNELISLSDSIASYDPTGSNNCLASNEPVGSSGPTASNELISSGDQIAFYDPTISNG